MQKRSNGFISPQMKFSQNCTDVTESRDHKIAHISITFQQQIQIVDGISPTMLQKVPQPSKLTWVSVQDVVLNSLRPSTQPSQPLPELSHFYTTTKQWCLAHVAMVLVGVSRLDTK